MTGRMNHVGYEKVIEALKAGGYYVSAGGGLMYARRGRYMHVSVLYALYAKDGRYIGMFTVATRNAVSKRVKLSYNEASLRVTLVG